MEKEEQLTQIIDVALVAGKDEEGLLLLRGVNGDLAELHRATFVASSVPARARSRL